MNSKLFVALTASILMFMSLAACTTAVESTPTDIPIETQALEINTPTIAPTSTKQPVINTPTTAPQQTAPAQQTPLSVSFPLSEPGPYFMGNREIKLVDQARGGRAITVTIWYPALEETDADGHTIRRNAQADMSSAPYPLILTGPASGDSLFGSNMASHGFVLAIIRFSDMDYHSNWDFGVIDHPLDMLFALDQIAANPPEGLEGVINTDQTGVTGYSWDGFFSLVLSGVRIDPAYYQAHCANPPLIEPAMGADRYLAMTCSLADNWDEFTQHVVEKITSSSDGLWQPVTDERIRAVLPMAPDGAWLYGEQGLAAVDRPVLLIAPTNDEYIPYQVETKFIFENLGAPEKSMISFVDKTHMMIFDPPQADQLRHFAVAYFGYYLQGREDYKQYFSEEFVSQFPDLAWGFYSD
jgi:predicted dienelactone hydrolase